MKSKFDHLLVLLTIIVVVLTIHTLYGPVKSPEVVDFSVSLEQARKVFPEAYKLYTPIDREGWTAVQDKHGKHVGSVVMTSPFCDDIIGWGGATPLIIATDSFGKIIKVVMLENQESPEFNEKVRKSGLMESWNGSLWSEAHLIELDAVSGATMTSSSVINTLKKRLALIKKSPEPVKKKYTFGWQDAIVIIITISGLYLCTTKLKRAGRLRFVQLFLSAVFLGFFTATCFSIALTSSIAVNGLSLASKPGITILIAVTVLVPLLLGKNVYCFFLCPFGALQEIFFKIVPLKFKIKPNIDKSLRYVRHILLVFLTGALLAGLEINPNNFEPFSVFILQTATPTAIVIAVLSLTVGCGINRPWCSYGCSAGALIDILKRPMPKNVDKCPGIPPEKENKK